jgi:hypothetical protein
MTDIATLKDKNIGKFTTIEEPLHTAMDTHKMITQVDSEWGLSIFPRMDEDEKLWTLEPYKLKDENNNLIEAVQNVTLNTPRVFGERVMAVQNEQEELLEINGFLKGKEMTGDQTAVIENFYRDIWYMANEQQIEALNPGLDYYLWEQADIRGRIGARVLLYQDNDGFHAEIMPFDMRNCIFGVGRYGLLWTAYKSILSREEVMDEYPGYALQDASTVTRWDYWNQNEEIVFLNGREYTGQDNPLGHPPVVIQLCQQGTFLQTSARALRMRGDSIFSANRELYPHLNAIASIMQTQNMLTLSPPQKLKSKSGKKLTSEPVYRMGRQVALEVGEDLEKIDAPDIQNSTRFFQALLDGAIQRGSISHIDWGNLSFQLSQVAIATLAGASRQVFSPRNLTMGRFKKLLLKELIRQFKYFDMKADIGRYGKHRTYTPKDLEGDYTVDFEYVANLPEEVAATYGLAAQATRWMDDRTIRKTILKYRNYDEIDQKFTVQTAQKVSKALSLFVMAQALDQQDKPDEARLLLIEVAQTLDAQTQAALGDITKMPNIEASNPSPEQSAAVMQSQQAAPEASRTTRKMEAPGAGEIMPEQGGI